MFVPLTTQLHEKHKVCLSKQVLCGLYKLLGTSCHKIIRQSYLNSLQIGGPIWLLQLWLNATFMPILHPETHSNMIFGVEGARLTHTTLDNGEIILQETSKKYVYMFYKSKTFVSTMAPFAARQRGLA